MDSPKRWSRRRSPAAHYCQVYDAVNSPPSHVSEGRGEGGSRPSHYYLLARSSFTSPKICCVRAASISPLHECHGKLLLRVPLQRLALVEEARLFHLLHAKQTKSDSQHKKLLLNTQQRYTRQAQASAQDNK
jgi:hypothetical protein